MNDPSRGYANSIESQKAVLAVLKSGAWIHGTEHKAFESDLADYLSVQHVLGVASGTDALEIALRAVGCSLGSKVITVANAGGYSSIAARSVGCEVIYCDVDSDKLLMDPDCLSSLLSKDISAVVVTHLYGNVAPVRIIKDLCQPFGIKVIEDCAQAIGAKENGFRVGTIGDVGAFSFYPTKNLGAIGDGGAIATNDPQIAERVSALRQYGWTSKYKIETPGGMNSRLDEIQAAVLRIGLPKLDFMNEKRLEILAKYNSVLQNSDIRLVTSIKTGNVAHLAVIQLPNRINREYFRRFLQDEGIQTEIHYPILDCHQAGLLNDANLSQIPNSLKSNSSIVSIPLFPGLTLAEVQTICKALYSISNLGNCG